MWRKAQECALNRASRLDLAAGKSPKEAYMWSMQESWRVMPARALQDKTSSLAKQLTRDSVKSQGQVAEPPCLLQTWPFALQTYISINTPYTHVL